MPPCASGYNTIHGMMNVSGVTIADFYGPKGCNAAQGGGTYALANHAKATDAFHPHYFSNMTVVNVATG